jgi:hypothetical protein
VDVKDIKCPLEWWEKHESLFSTITFLAHQILAIVGFQIEIERTFSLARIFTNLRRCHLQSNNLDNFIFVSKNWLNDPSVTCSSPSSLTESIDDDAALGEELEQYEGEFERDKRLDL